MIDRLKLLPGYLKTFGLVHGLSVFIAAEVNENKVILPGGISFELRKGTTDLLVFREVFLFRTYDFDLPFTTIPSIIVDLGANTGLSAIYFAHQFPKSLILAVEPETKNFNQLKKNIEPYPQVVPVRAALWNHDKMLRFKDPDGASWAMSVIEAQPDNPEGVPGLTMTSFMKQQKIGRIDLLKIDIEGSEKELFENADEWLPKTEIIIVETHDWIKEGTSRSVFQAIAKHNFAMRAINNLLVFNNLNVNHK